MPQKTQSQRYDTLRDEGKAHTYDPQTGEVEGWKFKARPAYIVSSKLLL